MYMLHAVWFKKDKFDKQSATKWLTEHSIHPIKQGHYTENMIKFRITKPNKNATYYSKYITEGIMFVMADD